MAVSSSPASSGLLTQVLTPAMIGVTTQLHRAFPSSVTDAEIPVTPPLVGGIPGYEVLHELGRGGMGIVFLARQVKLDRLIALKVLLKGRYAGADDKTRFRREAEAVARLHHPNIVSVHEVGEYDGVSYAAFEYVEGMTLAAALHTGDFTPAEAAALAEQIARGVQHAHDAGILHRDLKPGNILLQAKPAESGAAATASRFGAPPEKSDLVPRITDFGLAKRLDSDEALTATGTACGTPQYMAPEQITGQRGGIGPAADVHALGAILYEMLTGRGPFEGSNAAAILQRVLNDPPVRPRRVRTTVPADLETIVLKCLEKEPGRRYASAAALADDLARWRAGHGISARRAGPAERCGRWCRRNPTAAGLIAALFLGTASTAVLLVRALDAAEAEAAAKQHAVDARREAEAALAVAAVAEEAEARERRRAEENYQAARGAMQDSILRLVNDDRFRDFGANDLTRGLMEDYRPFIDRLLALNPEKAALLNEDSHVLTALAQFAIGTGDYAQAEDYLRTAIARADRSLTMEPERRSFAFAGAAARGELGTLKVRLGRIDEGLTLHKEAIATLETLVADNPRNSVYRRILCRLHLSLGSNSFRAGDHAFVEANCRAALEQTAVLIELRGEQVEFLQNRASAFNNLSVAAQKQGRHEESLAHLKECIALRETLASRPGIPQRYRYVADLALAVDNLGQHHMRQGRHSEAEVPYARAAALMTDVLRDAPGIVNYQLDQARYLTHLGTCRVNRGRFDSGGEALLQAKSLAQPVFDRTPDLLAARDTVRIIHRGLGTLYDRTGRHAEAAAEWAATVPLAPSETMKLRFQAWQAASLARDHRPSAARELIATVAAAPVENIDIWFDLAVVHTILAKTVPDGADSDAAKKYLAKIDNHSGRAAAAKMVRAHPLPDFAAAGSK